MRNIAGNRVFNMILLFTIIGELVLCQDLVQVKMRNFSPF